MEFVGCEISKSTAQAATLFHRVGEGAGEAARRTAQLQRLEPRRNGARLSPGEGPDRDDNRFAGCVLIDSMILPQVHLRNGESSALRCPFSRATRLYLKPILSSTHHRLVCEPVPCSHRARDLAADDPLRACWRTHLSALLPYPGRLAWPQRSFDACLVVESFRMFPQFDGVAWGPLSMGTQTSHSARSLFAEALTFGFESRRAPAVVQQAAKASAHETRRKDQPFVLMTGSKPCYDFSFL